MTIGAGMPPPRACEAARDAVIGRTGQGRCVRLMRPTGWWCGGGRGASQGCPAGQGPLGVSHLPQSETRGSQVLEALAMPRAVRPRRRPSQPVNWPRRRGAGGVPGRPASRCRHHAAQRKSLRRGLEGGWSFAQPANGRAHGTVDLPLKDPAGIGGRHWSPRRTMGTRIGGGGMNDRMARRMGRRLSRRSSRLRDWPQKLPLQASRQAGQADTAKQQNWSWT